MTIKAIAYRLTNRGEERTHPGDVYAHLSIELLLGASHDAAKEYDNSPSEYQLERLQKIRAQSTSAKYFSPSFSRSECVLKWMAAQSSHLDYGAEWFALSIDSANFDAAIFKLISKLRKATEKMYDDVTPTAILSTLHGMHARRVFYANDVYDAWIYQDEPTFDEISLPATWIEQRKENAESEVAV